MPPDSEKRVRGPSAAPSAVPRGVARIQMFPKVLGLESPAWQAGVLRLNDTRDDGEEPKRPQENFLPLTRPKA